MGLTIRLEETQFTEITIKLDILDLLRNFGFVAFLKIFGQFSIQDLRAISTQHMAPSFEVEKRPKIIQKLDEKY